MEFSAIGAMALVSIQAVSFLKDLTNRAWNRAITKLSAWAAGIGAAFLFANSSFASGIQVGEQTLAQMTFVDLVIVGLVAFSAGGFAYNVVKALDGSQTAKEPALIPESEPVVRKSRKK